MTDLAMRNGRRPLADQTSSRSTTFRLRSLPARYGFAVGAVLVSFAVTMLLIGIVQRSVLIFFWPAVVATAWFGGLGPALLCVFASVALVDYFVIPPPGFFLLAGDPTELLVAATFVGLAMATSWAVEKLEHARNDAAKAAADNLIVARQFDEQGLELTQQLEESQAMQEELEASTEELAERTAEAEAASRFSQGRS